MKAFRGTTYRHNRQKVHTFLGSDFVLLSFIFVYTTLQLSDQSKLTSLFFCCLVFLILWLCIAFYYFYAPLSHRVSSHIWPYSNAIIMKRKINGTGREMIWEVNTGGQTFFSFFLLSYCRLLVNHVTFRCMSDLIYWLQICFSISEIQRTGLFFMGIIMRGDIDISGGDDMFIWYFE